MVKVVTALIARPSPAAGPEHMDEQQKDGVRASIFCCLTRVLGSDQNARSKAEEELKTLEVTEGQSLSCRMYGLLMLFVYRIWSGPCRDNCFSR